MKNILLPLLLPILLPALSLGARAGVLPLPVDPVASPSTQLPFTPFAPRTGVLPTYEVTALLRNAREYEALVGRPAPAGIDFAREWVVFYGGGLQPTTAGRAAITGIDLTEGGHGLRVHTVLMLPEHGLQLAPGRGIPCALATIPRPRQEIWSLRADHVYVLFL